MTISEFKNRFDLKESEASILKWLNEGYIPGAIMNEETQAWDIPEDAWPPYTKARAKNTDSIYKSIVKACTVRRHVFANLYKISENEFQQYINQLAEIGVISVVKSKEMVHYYATLKSEEFLANKKPTEFIKDCLAQMAEGAAKGAVTVLINK